MFSASPLLLSLLTFPALAAEEEPPRFETYNTGLAYGFVDYALERRPFILDALAEDPADLVCLQEVWNPVDRDDITATLADSHPHVNAPPVIQTRATRAPVCGLFDLFGKERFVSCMTGECGDLEGDALTDCIVDECGPVLDALKTKKPECATSLMAQVGKSAPKALWTVVSPFKRAGIYAYEGSDGLMLLTRDAHLDSGVVDFSDIATLNRRRALWADIEVDGIPTRVYCLHLTSDLTGIAPYPGPFESWNAENFAQVERLIEHAADAPEAVVLLGDFNCGAANEADEVIAESPASCLRLEEAGFLDSHNGEDIDCTFCSANTLTEEGEESTLIDHVFARGLDTAHGKRTRDGLITLPDGKEVHMSDHYGYTVNLSAPAPDEPEEEALDEEGETPEDSGNDAESATPEPN